VTDQPNLDAEMPRDAGVDQDRPDTPGREGRPDDSRTEGAHLLASEARERLEPQGFSEQQILDWTEAYIAEHGAGDVDGLIAWIDAQQG
jgi:hypothetical protein